MPISGGGAFPAAYTAARAAYLDNINENLADLFYTNFATQVDDYEGIVVTGTCTNPEMLINNILTPADVANFQLVNEYVQINFGMSVYIKQIRIHGDAGSTAASRYRLQAYVNGVWVDALVDIVDPDVDDWGPLGWIDLDTPRVSALWRFECTTRAASAVITEIELRGVGVGG